MSLLGDSAEVLTGALSGALGGLLGGENAPPILETIVAREASVDYAAVYAEEAFNQLRASAADRSQRAVSIAQTSDSLGGALGVGLVPVDVVTEHAYAAMVGASPDRLALGSDVNPEQRVEALSAHLNALAATVEEAPTGAVDKTTVHAAVDFAAAVEGDEQVARIEAARQAAENARAQDPNTRFALAASN